MTRPALIAVALLLTAAGLVALGTKPASAYLLGGLGCRIINGHHYAIRIGSITLLCANCGFPHETSEATR